MIWASASKQLTRLILLLVLPCMPCLAVQTDKGGKTPSAVTAEYGDESKVTQVEEKKSKRPRLKFRNGPVCMCSGGLSEKEIQAAWIKRYSQAKDLEQ